MLAVLYPVILFILLSPNILLRLPPGGDKFTVVLVHALVFGLVLHFTSSMTSGYGSEMMMGGGLGSGGAPVDFLGSQGGMYGAAMSPDAPPMIAGLKSFKRRGM
jgi:hypothetical protein